MMKPFLPIIKWNTNINGEILVLTTRYKEGLGTGSLSQITQ